MRTQDSVKSKTPAKSKTSAKNKKTSPKLKTAPPSREEIAQLAEKYWMERGRPDGSPEQDWLRAERDLMGMAS
ncbi:MAG TPA: DUF2934 domain-containing protein [Acidisarcina sp.]|nr:DUF2934 domain-containing protein [Acidisarcina sp.]